MLAAPDRQLTVIDHPKFARPFTARIPHAGNCTNLVLLS
jgi:hypothetical protein